MAHTHYTPYTVESALADPEGSELQTLLRRVRSCPPCRDALAQLLGWLERLDHFDPVVAAEFLTREEFFERLLFEYDTHPDRLAALQLDPLFQHWGLCTRLLEESRHARPTDPERAFELGELALRVALLLDPEFYHPQWVLDLLARAAARLGDALRAAASLDAAEELFRTAQHWLRQGTGRLAVAAEVARLQARLLQDQGRHEEALAVLERALAPPRPSDATPQNGLLYWLLRDGHPVEHLEGPETDSGGA